MYEKKFWEVGRVSVDTMLSTVFMSHILYLQR